MPVDFCYDLALRQRKCQNGISLDVDNVFTNIENNEEIILSFGYVLKVISKNNDDVTIELNNFSLLNPVRFKIPNGTCKTFDLPIYNGNFILIIGVVQRTCNCPVC